MNTVKQVQIEYIETSVLKFAPFNPPSRTEKRALTKLRAKIEKAGCILVPILITNDNFVAEGNRRLTIARELGMETIPAIRYDMSLAELWANANGGIMAPQPRTWMEAVYGGLPVEEAPDKERRQITELRRIMGEDYFSELARNGRSPYILTMAQSVARYCGDESDKFIKQTIVWFEDCQQQFAVRRAMGDKCPPEVLASAINDNRVIRQYWGMG